MRFRRLLLGLVVMFSMSLLFPCSPSEDAYISLRYVINIRAAGGYSYNYGEILYGATSILYTLLVALTPLDPIISMTVVNTALAICIITILSYQSNMLGTILAALLVSPFITLGFDVLLFSFALLVLYFLKSSDNPYLIATALLFAITTRPEGFFIAAVYWIILFDRSRETGMKVLKFCIPVILAYVLLLWLYFGAILPSSFAFKSGGMINPDSMVRTGWYFIQSPMIAIVGLVAITADDLVSLLPTGVYAVATTFFIQLQNIFHRFQVPVALVLFAALKFPDTESKQKKLVVVGFAILVLVAQFDYMINQMPYEEEDINAKIGYALANFRGTILLTEAGMLAYALGLNWTVYDISGLNPSYISGLPDLIQFRSVGLIAGDWSKVAQDLALAENYTLAACLIQRVYEGIDHLVTHEAFHWYYVSQESTQYNELLNTIRATAQQLMED